MLLVCSTGSLAQNIDVFLWEKLRLIVYPRHSCQDITFGLSESFAVNAEFLKIVPLYPSFIINFIDIILSICIIYIDAAS